MKTHFDSSALIAAFVEGHPKHQSALSWLKRAKKKEIGFIVAAHSLLEIYSVLTGAPFKPRISPVTAKMLITRNIINDAEIVSLSSTEYFQVLENMNDLGLIGGIIYDATIVACARKSGSKQLVTSNEKDFSRLITDGSIDIVGL